jgi:hypothetical protein
LLTNQTRGYSRSSAAKPTYINANTNSVPGLIEPLNTKHGSLQSRKAQQSLRVAVAKSYHELIRLLCHCWRWKHHGCNGQFLSGNKSHRATAVVDDMKKATLSIPHSHGADVRISGAAFKMSGTVFQLPSSASPTPQQQ